MTKKSHPEWDCVCKTCGAEYRGSQSSGGHCADMCHQTFANDATATAHFVAPRGDYSNVRCLTPAEMEAKGWRLTDRGWTKHPPMPEAQKVARKAAWGR